MNGKLILSLLLATAPALAAQGAPARAADSAAVLATIERFHAALGAGDSAAVLALLDPEVLVLESGGAERLADYRAHHLPADIEFAQAVTGTRTVLRVATEGSVAWVAASTTSQGTFRGRAINSAGVELMVLRRSTGSWRIEAIHWSSRARRP